MKNRNLGLILICFILLVSCRSIPCMSVEALQDSYDVFLDDHFEYVDADESLGDESKAILLRHAMTHKELLDELGKLCGE